MKTLEDRINQVYQTGEMLFEKSDVSRINPLIVYDVIIKEEIEGIEIKKNEIVKAYGNNINGHKRILIFNANELKR